MVKKILIISLVLIFFFSSFLKMGHAVSLNEVKTYINKTVIINIDFQQGRLCDTSGRRTYVGKVLQIFENSNGTQFLSLLLGFEEGNTGFPTYSFYSNQTVEQIRINRITNIKEFPKQ